MCEEDPIIGIDLGTTYSCVAVVKNDQVEIIYGDNGSHTMASCVFFNDSGERIVGDTAKDKSYRNPLSTVYGVKRFIGRSYEEYIEQESNMFFPYLVENKNDRPKICIQFKDEIKYFAPEEISGMVLSKLKERAEEVLGKTVSRAVITVPAHFNDAQRQATKDAGKIAGLEVLRVMNEPTAAAMAYELHNKYEDSRQCNVLIYDFGGGTFDVSIVNIGGDIIDVMATNGEAFLGGDDIDKRLTEHMINEFKRKHGEDISEAKKAVRRIQQQCEKAKRSLSSCLNVNLEIDLLYKGKDLTVDLNRGQLEHMNMDLFTKTLDCVEKTLKDADITKDDVNEIVLVGGSTRIPRVREMVQKYFNNKELNASLNPDEAVAIGAARQAAILYGSESQRITSILLYDVCSLSLGIEIQGGVMSVIIPRNTKLPAQVSKLYQTSRDNQIEVELPIYEGERKMVSGNRLLGKFVLSNLKPAPRGEVKFNVIFDINTDGILNVCAEELSGSNRKDITVVSHKGHLTEEDISEMIAQGEMFKEQDKQKKLIVEAKIMLQNYCYDILHLLEEIYMEEDDKDVVKNTCEDTITWLTMNENLSKDDYLNKKDEIYKICDPLISLHI